MRASSPSPFSWSSQSWSLVTSSAWWFNIRYTNGPLFYWRFQLELATAWHHLRGSQSAGRRPGPALQPRALCEGGSWNLWSDWRIIGKLPFWLLELWMGDQALFVKWGTPWDPWEELLCALLGVGDPWQVYLIFQWAYTCVSACERQVASLNELNDKQRKEEEYI